MYILKKNLIRISNMFSSEYNIFMIHIHYNFIITCLFYLDTSNYNIS